MIIIADLTLTQSDWLLYSCSDVNEWLLLLYVCVSVCLFWPRAGGRILHAAYWGTPGWGPAAYRWHGGGQNEPDCGTDHQPLPTKAHHRPASSGEGGSPTIFRLNTWPISHRVGLLWRAQEEGEIGPLDRQLLRLI